jgi:hypothetical protein
MVKDQRRAARSGDLALAVKPPRAIGQRLSGWHNSTEDKMWTRFMDMHSGGETKERNPKTGRWYEYIYIEAPLEQAKLIFCSRFGHDPENITCDCCGEDYSIDEEFSLREATAFERGCDYDLKVHGYVERGDSNRSYRPYRTLEDFLTDPEVCVIRAEDIPGMGD